MLKCSSFGSWTFTYDRKYHLIREGTNELTSKLDCGSGLAKYYTVNVTGASEPFSLPTNENSSGNDSPFPFSLPASNNNDDDSSRDDDSNMIPIMKVKITKNQTAMTMEKRRTKGKKKERKRVQRENRKVKVQKVRTNN